MTYTVKELSRKTGVSGHAIRFYTDRGLLPCRRDANNRRVFDDESVNWVTTIRCLRKCGVSVEDVGLYIKLCLEGKATLSKRYEFMLRQRDLARARLKEARELLGYVDRKVAYYQDILTGRLPDDLHPAGPAGNFNPAKNFSEASCLNGRKD